jgi:outer membrane protein assembly factor BamB
MSGGNRILPTAARVAAMLALPVLAACSSLNPFSSSGPQMAPVPEASASARLTIAWEGKVGAADGQVFHPAVVDGAVFAAGRKGTVARFDEGRTAWRVDLDRKLSAGVGANAALAVVVTDKGSVVALDAATGQERWRSALNSEVLAPPGVGEQTVVVRTSDNRLIGLDAADGKRRWVYQRSTPPLALRSFAGVNIVGDLAVAGFPGGKLVAVSLLNGGAAWELTVANPKGATELERVADISGLPVVHGQELCAVAYQGRIGCFDGSTGNALWTREFSSSVGLDRDSRHVYVTDDKDGVFAMDAFNGATLWKQDKFSMRGITSPLAVGDFVAVADREGYVLLMSRDDGVVAARVRADSSAIRAAPQAYRSGLVVQSQDGGVYALSVN